MSFGLPNTFLTIPDSPNHIEEESWYLGDFNQDSILPQNFEFDQYQPIDKLASFHFNEIELEDESDTDSQYCDSVSLFESMLTLISYLIRPNSEANTDSYPYRAWTWTTYFG